MQLFDTGPCRRGHAPWIPCGNLGDAVRLHGLLVPVQSLAGPSAESRGHDPIRACAGVHHGGWTVRVGAAGQLFAACRASGCTTCSLESTSSRPPQGNKSSVLSRTCI